MPYTVAIALIHGTVEEHHFDDACRRDEAILALAQRIKVKATDEADRRMPEAMLCRLKIITTSGQDCESAIEYHRGHWRNPMSDSEVEAKFRPLAAKALDAGKTDRLLDGLRDLERLKTASDIVRLTTATERSG